MSLDSAGLFAGLTSHAQKLGIFDRVTGHESLNPPGNGLTCDVFFVSLRPFAAGSGLATTTGVALFMARIYKPNMRPEDYVEHELLSAGDALIAAYSGEFDLGGRIRNVDLQGQTGTPLSAQGGWLRIDEGMYRTCDVTIPLVVNDLWTQAP